MIKYYPLNQLNLNLIIDKNQYFQKCDLYINERSLNLK